MSELENKLREIITTAASEMQRNESIQNDLRPTLILRKSSDKKSIDLKLSIHYQLTNDEALRILRASPSSFNKEIEKAAERKKIRNFKTTASYSVELQNGYGMNQVISIPVENFFDIKFDSENKRISCTTESIRISQIPSENNESFAFIIRKYNSSSAMSGIESETINTGILSLMEPRIPTDISQSIYRTQSSIDAPIIGDLHVEVMRDSVSGFFTVDNRILKQDSFELYMRTGQSIEQKSVQINISSVVPNVTKDENLTMYKFRTNTSGSNISFSISYNRFSNAIHAKEIITDLNQHIVGLDRNPLSYVEDLRLLRDLENTYEKTRRFIENKEEDLVLYEEVVGTKRGKIRILEDIKKYFSDASEFIKNANFMKIGEDGEIIDNMPNHAYIEIDLGSITAPYKPISEERLFSSASYNLEEFQAAIRTNFTDRNKTTLRPHYAKALIESTDSQATEVLTETHRALDSLNQENKNRGAAYLLTGYTKTSLKKSGILLKKPIWKSALDNDFERGTYLAQVLIINPDGNLYEQYLTVSKE